MSSFKDKKIVLTGGAGFLGKYVIKELERKGAKDVFVVHVEDYDLRDLEMIKRLLSKTNPDIIIHLAAIVGGIGANRENPGRFFYENLIMGVQ